MSNTEPLSGIEPRFEFRVWGRSLDAVTARIRALSDPGQVRTSSETYLVAAGVDEVNSKVRDGLLDVKVLVDELRGFEQWVPWVKTGFPLAAAFLIDGLFSRLRLPAPTLARDEYEFEQFLDEVVAPHPDLTAVEVAKRRKSYQVAGCITEIADVVIGRHELQTAGIESVDPDALSEALRLVGLEGRANVSYPRAIKRVLAAAEG